MQTEIVNAVRNAGVIGAGGGGFPTYVKLQAKADTVIANGSECEPLLATDKTFLKLKAHQVVEGLHIAMKATGAKKGVIAVKRCYEDVVAAVESSLRSTQYAIRSTSLELLDNYYPAGDEFMLVYDVAGRVIPEGGLPLNVGVVVSNVITLAQIAEGVNGKPVTRRFVTVAGEVARPCVISAPIGASYKDLIKIAGGSTIEDPAVIDGGPMMGKLIDDLEEGVGKTTSGVLVMPANHFVVQMKRRTILQEVKRSRAACCQCFRCTDLCPRNNLGHNIYPHMTMRTIDYNQSEPTEHITSAFLCSQCGMCEMAACDIMGLSPRRIFAEYRKQLVAKGIKNPHGRKDFAVRKGYSGGKISIPMLLKKTGLSGYARPLSFEGDADVSRVRIPLARHTGIPAAPVVKVGAKVRMCDVIAATAADKLGTVYHASISGVVTDVDERLIEIRSA